jgi:peptide/nickel transport system substrate-binding protein
VEHQKGVKLVLEKNGSYWGGAPPIDQLVVRPITESQAAVSALLAGEVHLITNASADSLDVLKARPELAIKMAEPPSTYAWNFKLSQAPFSDKRFRQALNYAVDRETYCKEILRGLGRPAKSFFAPGSIGYDANRPGYTYDPDLAKSLLKEAGVADGFSFKMQTYKAQGQDTVALYVKDQLAKIGINVKVELLEYQTMATNINKDGIAADCGALGWSFSNDRPVSFDRLFTNAFLVPNGPNYTGFNNPQVEELTQKAWRTTDQAEKVRLYGQAEAIVTEEVPWLFIYHPIEPRVYSKKMTWSSANSQWYTLRNASLV